MNKFYIVGFLMICTAAVQATPVNWLRESKMTDLEKIISEIPKEDRKDFVKYCLTKVLEENHGSEMLRAVPNFEKFVDVEIPSEASQELYNLVQTTYELSDDQLLEYVTYGPICFPSGCVDPGDIGSLCCPFMVQNLPLKHE